MRSAVTPTFWSYSLIDRDLQECMRTLARNPHPNVSWSILAEFGVLSCPQSTHKSMTDSRGDIGEGEWEQTTGFRSAELKLTRSNWSCSCFRTNLASLPRRIPMRMTYKTISLDPRQKRICKQVMRVDPLPSGEEPRSRDWRFRFVEAQLDYDLPDIGTELTAMIPTLPPRRQSLQPVTPWQPDNL